MDSTLDDMMSMLSDLSGVCDAGMQTNLFRKITEDFNIEFGHPADSGFDADYPTEAQRATDKIAAIQPIVHKSKPIRRANGRVIMIPTAADVEKVIRPPRDHNICQSGHRNMFGTESIYEETELFSAPITTTVTMEGGMSNVSFHEKDLIEKCVPSDEILVYRCNYGHKTYAGYQPPSKERRCTRGRKKQPRIKKERKKQGMGTDFNSQLTMVVLSTLDDSLNIDKTIETIETIETNETTDNDEIADKIPQIPQIPQISSDAKVYKFKVFRTGKIQLPGGRPAVVEDLMACINKVVNQMNNLLHPGEEDPTKLCAMIDFVPVMKNYKFIAKLQPNTIIDLQQLYKVLSAKQACKADKNIIDPGNKKFNAAHNIAVVKYTREETKLSIRFKTPIPDCPDKKTRVNIFMRGKINILGAFDPDVTREIVDYLHNVFLENNDIFVMENQRTVEVRAPIVIPPLEISDEIAQTCCAILEEWGMLDWLDFVPSHE